MHVLHLSLEFKHLSSTEAKEPTLPKYLPIAGEGENRWIDTFQQGIGA